MDSDIFVVVRVSLEKDPVRAHVGLISKKLIFPVT